MSKILQRCGVLRFSVLISMCMLLSACAIGEGARSAPTTAHGMEGRCALPGQASAGCIVGHVGGPATAIAAAGEHMLLGHPSELAILDIADPSAPQRVGYALISALDMVVQGDLAYVAGRKGLTIVDVSTPATPTVLAFLATPSSATAIAKEQERVYLAVHLAGIYVIDVSVPDRPILENELDIDGRISDIAAHALHLYAVTNFGFQIFDVTDTKRPLARAFYESDGSTFSMTIDEDIAYVGVSGAIQIVNLETPDRPVVLGEISLDGTPLRVTVLGDRLYVAGGRGVGVVDLWPNAANPVEGNVAAGGQLGASTGKASNWFEFSGAIWDVATTGDLAYVADGLGGMQIVRLDPARPPATIGKYAVPNAVFSVAVDSDRAYVVNGDGGLWTIDIARPTRPRTQTSRRFLHYVHEVVVANNTVYLVTSSQGDGVRVLDISTPTGCHDDVVYAVESRVTSLFAVPDAAVIGLEGVGLQLIETRADCRLLARGIFRFSSAVREVVAVDQRAYVASDGGEIIVIDISNPDEMFEESTLRLGSPVEHLAIADGDLIAATRAGDVIVVQIALGAAPTIASRVDNDEPIHEMIYAHGRLFVASAEEVIIYSLNGRNGPVQVGRLPLPAGTTGIDVDGRHIYAATGLDGLYIVRIGI